MLSVVVVYTDEDVLRSWTLASIYSQRISCELILLDNRDNKYRSAAMALNAGCGKATGDYIMCVHQDVRFESNDFFSHLISYMKNLEHVGIAGVAGMSRSGANFYARCRNQVSHGYPEKSTWGNPINSPEEVQTLDECLIVIPRAVYNSHPFDEVTCDNWHLYAVDYCLTMIEHGFKVYALPLHIYHKFTGTSIFKRVMIWDSEQTSNYYHSLRKVLSKHREYFRTIHTTCGEWSTAYGVTIQRIYKGIRRRISMPVDV